MTSSSRLACVPRAALHVTTIPRDPLLRLQRNGVTTARGVAEVDLAPNPHRRGLQRSTPRHPGFITFAKTLSVTLPVPASSGAVRIYLRQDSSREAEIFANGTKSPKGGRE